MMEYTGQGSTITKGLYHLSDATDSSGNGKNLTTGGTVTYVAGKFSNCASATWSPSNYLKHTSFLGSNLGTGNFTMGCWFKRNGLPTTDYTPTIMAYGVNGNGSRTGIFATKANGYAGLQTYNNPAGETSVTSTTNICDNVWHSVVAKRIGTTITVYVDGQVAGTTTGTIRDVSGDTIWFGTHGDATYDAIGAGMIDDAFFENYGWTDAEVLAYYNARITTFSRKPTMFRCF